MTARKVGAWAGVIAAVGIWTLPLRHHADTAPERARGDEVRAHLRDEALAHARTRLGDGNRAALLAPPPDPAGALTRDFVECEFIPRAAGGTSFKFECALADGEVVRVKYGHEPEIYAEVAASRLLSALGYATDHVYLVPRLRCHGCPPAPFVTALVFDAIGADVPRAAGYTDYEWVSVERKFEAAPIEDDERKGWAFWELKNVGAPRDDLDALRLLAVFLAHWDNKAENQRLVCMDEEAEPDEDIRPCRDALLMVHDVGSTFGPFKVNLSQWRQTPVWADRASCTVSMRAYPYGGSTFPDARISEAARLRVGRALASFSDAELQQWLTAARFPQYYAGTDDEKDLAAWTAAYHERVDQILSARCPS